MARLMTGDIAGADGLHRKYLDARAAAHDPASLSPRRNGNGLCGRRKEAVLGMEASARVAETGPLRDLAARAYAELAIWNAVLGNRDQAAASARKAESLAGPGSAGILRVAGILCRPPTPGIAPGDPLQSLATACAFLLNRQFQSAADLLGKLYATGVPADGEDGLPILLAWTYLETGPAAEAAPLLRLNPIPSPSGVSALSAFYFPRLYSLRAALAEKQGKREEAAENRRVFHLLSGTSRLVWD